jgi:FtsZ-binding cell division protein ZapB
MKKMTRTKEVDPDSGDIPDYKSPPSRLVHSLRKAYDNLRSKLKDARNNIKYYQIKVRDLEKSRNHHKKEAAKLKKQVHEMNIANENLKNSRNEVEVKKKTTK